MCSTAILYVTLCMQSQFCYDTTRHCQQESMPISACVQIEIKSSPDVKLEMGAAACIVIWSWPIVAGTVNFNFRLVV